MTSLMIVIVLINTIIKYSKNRRIKELDTYKFTKYSIILFIILKISMTTNLYILSLYENPIYKMQYFTAVNIMTLLSLIFAIWINFAIIFLKYDVLNNEMKKLSFIDKLTNLPNRRKIMEQVGKSYNLNMRDKLNFALAILDIDDFKKVNDEYGYTIGDEVLADFSKFLIEEIREIDFVGRYGGEEFIFIIYVDNMDEIKIILNRLLLKLNNCT